MEAERLKYRLCTLGRFTSVQVVVQVIGIASGILLVRTLSKEEYAYFTIAATMQAAMNVLADSGITSALSATGGKVWNNRVLFGQLISTALYLRRYPAVASIIVITPLMLWLLNGNGASISSAILIATAVLSGFYFQITDGVLIIVPRLFSQIRRIQHIDLASALFRLILILIAYALLLNAATAVIAAAASFGMQYYFLKRWVAKDINIRSRISHEDKHTILRIVRSQAPHAVYFCIQGQISIWLISIFGDASGVAEVGALGRITVIFTIMNTILSSIALPRFARCQTKSALVGKYWQILGIYSLLSLALLAFVIFIPGVFLWILGKNYAHLNVELILMTLSAVLYTMLGTIWSINASRAWILSAWASIPVGIIAQILLLSILNVSTVKGVLLFNILLTLPGFIMHGYRSYAGFKTVGAGAFTYDNANLKKSI